MPAVRLTLDLDADLVEALRRAASNAGTTSEALAAEAVAQCLEIALRHKVLIERMESVDAQFAAIAHFVEEATAEGGTEGIDLERLCRYPRKPR